MWSRVWLAGRFWKVLESKGEVNSAYVAIIFTPQWRMSYFFLVLTSTSKCKIVCCTMGWNWNLISFLFFPKHVIEGVRENIHDTEEVISLLFLHLCGEGLGLGPIRSAVIIKKNMCIKQWRKVKGCSRRFISDWEKREHDREMLHSFENSSNI